jgi:DNA-binding Lrp family transcriptional regulator
MRRRPGVARLPGMFEYSEMLGPEARSIVGYLVSEVGLGNPVPTREVGELLDLSETELGDGIEELVDLDIITAHGPYLTHLEPKGGAWLYVDAGTLGYDILRDMLAVAESTVERETASPEELVADTGLPPERVNVAALALEHEDRIQLVKFHVRGYAFNEARATRHTRAFVRENRQ